jgi:hypothetical protein
MKSKLGKVLLALVILAVVAGLVVFFFLDSIIKKGVETVGPAVTKVNVTLAAAHVSPFSGSGELKGLVVGNPPNYKSPSSIQVGSVAVALDPASALSKKVVIHKVHVVAPQITFEGGLGGNNLNEILKSVQGTSGASKEGTSREPGSEKKLQVDDFLITGGSVHVISELLGSKELTVPLPEIHLTNLGQGEGGITSAELLERVFSEITKAAIAAAGNIAGKATDSLKNVGSGGTKEIEKATKGLGDLFKKK